MSIQHYKIKHIVNRYQHSKLKYSYRETEHKQYVPLGTKVRATAWSIKADTLATFLITTTHKIGTRHTQYHQLPSFLNAKSVHA